MNNYKDLFEDWLDQEYGITPDVLTDEEFDDLYQEYMHELDIAD